MAGDGTIYISNLQGEGDSFAWHPYYSGESDASMFVNYASLVSNHSSSFSGDFYPMRDFCERKLGYSMEILKQRIDESPYHKFHLKDARYKFEFRKCGLFIIITFKSRVKKRALEECVELIYESLKGDKEYYEMVRRFE